MVSKGRDRSLAPGAMEMALDKSHVLSAARRSVTSPSLQNHLHSEAVDIATRKVQVADVIGLERLAGNAVLWYAVSSRSAFHRDARPFLDSCITHSRDAERHASHGEI